MIRFVVSVLLLFSNVQMAILPDPFPSLSKLSLKSLIQEVVLGKVDLTILRGFYITYEDGLDILAAFLTKHFHNYDFEQYKRELELIYKSEVLSCVLSGNFYENEDSQETRTLFEELYDVGLFTTISQSFNPALEVIQDRIIAFSKQYMPSRGIDLINDFVLSLPVLGKFGRLEELCPILLHIIRLEKFNEPLGNEIIKILDDYQTELKKWAETMKFPIIEATSLNGRPLHYIKNAVETWNCFTSEFTFKSMEELHEMLTWEAKRLIAFASSYERGMVVIAMLLVRADFDLKIEGGESNDITSQLLSINSFGNPYIELILKCFTDHNESIFDLLTKRKIEEGINFSIFPIHQTIRSIYRLIGLTLFNLEDESNLAKGYSQSKLGLISFSRHYLQNKFNEGRPDQPKISFLGTVMYSEIEKIFKFFFDLYFDSHIKKGTKIDELGAVELILTAGWFVNETRALQLIKFIDFDDEKATNNIIFYSIARLPWNVKEEVIKKLNHSYNRRGIAGINAEDLIKLVPVPQLMIENPQYSSKTLYYDFTTEKALKEFFIDSDGLFKIVSGHLLDNNSANDFLEEFKTIDGFCIFKQSYPCSLDIMITILPLARSFLRGGNALVIYWEMLRIYYYGSFTTFLNILEFYQGSCFKILKKPFPVN